MSTKQKARDRVKTGRAKGKSAEAPVPAVVETPVKAGRKPNATSIRQTILSGLRAGKTNAEITAELQELAPQSAAASKSGRHISFYRSWLRKNEPGALPARTAA